MSRYRLYPEAAQEEKLLMHCGHARFVWNLAVEQLSYASRGRWCPNFAQQCQQLAEARRAFPWLAKGSSIVQQQALKDFDQAMKHWRNGVLRRPTWRKAGRREGFRIVGQDNLHVEQLNRRWSRVMIPKVGWVKLRRTCALPEFKSYRVVLDPSGRWHIAFATTREPIEGPCDGSVVGIDRGIAVTLTLSDGSTYQAPGPIPVKAAQRALARCQRGSNRRLKARRRYAKRCARDTDRRKDWVEKRSTDIARRYDTIRIEDLKVANMVRSARGTLEKPGRNVRAKSGLNRSIHQSGWSMFATKLARKADGRVEKIYPAFTSQRCSVCQHVDSKSRKSQALFACTACGYTANADVNAARNIAAGLAARGAGKVPALKRRPKLAPAA